MITVEDAADVAAFKDYVVPATAPVAPVVAAAPTPTPVATTPPPVATVPVVVKPAASPPSAPVPVSTPIAATSSTNSHSFSTAIPGMTYVNTKKSPLTYTLNADQTKYIDLYGTTGQSPIS